MEQNQLHNNNQISRVYRSRKQARLVYDRMSRWYDFISTNDERSLTEFGIDQLDPHPGDFILEIGCGTGHGLTYLSRILTSSHGIVGLDLSYGMLTRTQRLLNRSNFSKAVKLHQGDACQLPYATGIFSAVFMSFMIELIDTPEILLVLSESKRVLMRDGRICIVCLEKQERMSVRIYELFHKLMPTFVDCRPIFIQNNLIQTGFSINSCISKSMWGLPVNIVTASVGDHQLGGT